MRHESCRSRVARIWRQTYTGSAASRSALQWNTSSSRRERHTSTSTSPWSSGRCASDATKHAFTAPIEVPHTMSMAGCAPSASASSPRR
jgi:hypothetical protein